jgi:putative DNA primase/helicase
MASSELTAQQVEHNIRRMLSIEHEAGRTDRGNANLLRQIVGANLRYVVERKQWLTWQAGRWSVDEHETFIRHDALKVAYWYLDMARIERSTPDGNADRTKEFEKWGRKCRNSDTLNRMITELTHIMGVPISVNELDRDPWLLGVANGVVDLRTGELRTRESAEDFVTKRCTVKYIPDAPAPRWERFIAEVTGVQGATPDDFYPRPVLARYLQKMLGYCCTGSTREQKLFIAVGAGSNGKSQLFETVRRVLGAYSAILPAEALMATKFAADPERPTSIAASLEGARFVMASESKDGQRLDVGIVKNHTGDAKMSARRMRENSRSFDISHKLVLLTNVRPGIDHMDAAIRGRLHLVPFDRRWNRPGDIERDPTLPDGDKQLSETLRAEAEGILAWLVRGAVLYEQEGLDPPDEVLALTKDFIATQDHLGRWINAACEPCAAKEGTTASDLLCHFNNWCSQEGVESPFKTTSAFGTALSNKQVSSERTKHAVKRGLRIVGDAASPDVDPLS